MPNYRKRSDGPDQSSEKLESRRLRYDYRGKKKGVRFAANNSECRNLAGIVERISSAIQRNIGDAKGRVYQVVKVVVDAI
jgi:hypothetical protein